MIPNHAVREVISSEIEGREKFRISTDDSAHVMHILRDTLYSDKVLAVIREYSSNAWDSHRQAGKPDLPIKVVVPTAKDPTLTIQDFGVGLSHEDVFNVYTQYGKSTKRKDNNSVGMLGIGSKSAFAYSDTFTITACHGGKRRVYVAVLDESEEGYINHLSEEDCGKETGVSIQIPVKPQDIAEFTDKARRFFQHFRPRPDINIDLPPAPRNAAELSNGMIWKPSYEFERAWYAVMGCVPYKLDLTQVSRDTAHLDDGVGISDKLSNLAGFLFFDIGQLQVSASREGLKYGAPTKNALVEKFNDLVDEFVKKSIDDIEKAASSKWDRRVRAQVLNDMGIPIPKDFATLFDERVDLYVDEKEPKLFTFSRQGHGDIRYLTVGRQSRILLKDSDRKLSGYQFQDDPTLVVRRDESTSWEDVLKELEANIKAADIEGIPIGKLSECAWTKPWEPPPPAKKVADPKHRVRTFILKGENSEGWEGKKSENWEIKKREPTKDDVYVILSGFKGIGFDIYELYDEDSTFLRELAGKEMPKIYGYKTTTKKPVVVSPELGTEYREWRKQIAKSLLTPEIKKELELLGWAQVFASEHVHIPRGVSQKMADLLGEDNPITRIYRMRKRGKEYWKKTSGTRISQLQSLQAKTGYVTKAAGLLRDVYARYPLLKISGGFSNLWGPNTQEWMKYVKLVDQTSAAAPVIDIQEKHDGNDDAGTAVHADERVDLGGVGGEAVHGGEGVAALPPAPGGAPLEELGGGAGAPDAGEEPRVMDEGEVQHRLVG